MKNTLLFSTLIVGLALAGCNKSTRTSTASSDAQRDRTGYASNPAATDQTATTPATTDNSKSFGSRVDSATNRASDSMANAASSLSSAASGAVSQARIMEWKLSASDLQTDLDNNNTIIRTKDTAAGAPTGSVDKSIVKSSVEGKFAADSELAALKLDVDADKSGEVHLSGKASSADEVGKAIALALDTDGVNKVSSKIKLDKDAKTNR